MVDRPASTLVRSMDMKETGEVENRLRGMPTTGGCRLSKEEPSSLKPEGRREASHQVRRGAAAWEAAGMVKDLARSGICSGPLWQDSRKALRP